MTIPTIASYTVPAQLPPNRVTWQLDPDRATLLVHDMQSYFTGAFAGPEPLPEVIGAINRLRATCRQRGVPVVFTRQPGGQTPAERGLLGELWGAGVPAGAGHESIIGELAPAPADVVLTKRRYSAFAGTDLAGLLGRRDQLVVTGIYAHIGVLATACDAFMRDVQPFVVADAVADFSAAHHRTAMRYVADRCGVVTTAGAAVKALAG